MTHKKRSSSGFTLLEVLLSATILSLGLVGALGAFSMASRWATSAARLDDAVRLARNELTQATAVVETDGLRPATKVSGVYTCKVAYAAKSEGLSAATVTVTWNERSIPRSFVLSQVFKPESKATPQ